MTKDGQDPAGWLHGFLERHGGTSGTIHHVSGDVLVLAASINIPPPVNEIIAMVPYGKGMAGLAWQRNEPVMTCNLKEDNSGDVRPGAKAVNAGSGVALPIRDLARNVRAIVGIAYKDPRDLSQPEIQTLLSDASTLP